jgi:hypothetical protein
VSSLFFWIFPITCFLWQACSSYLRQGSRPLAGSLLLCHYKGCAGRATRGRRRWEHTGPSLGERARAQRRSSGAVEIQWIGSGGRTLGGRGRIGMPGPSGCGLSGRYLRCGLSGQDAHDQLDRTAGIQVLFSTWE